VLTAAQVTAMRATTASVLPDVATLERLTTVSDGGGGSTETWAQVGVPVACRIAPLAGGEGGQAGGRVADETTHVVTVAAGTEVTERDRLLIAGTRYEVTVVRERGAWELARRVEVREAS